MIYFDTLQYVKTLEASGVPEKQAEAMAMAKAQQEALSECLDTTLSTKKDIQSLKKDLSTLENKLTGEIEPMKIDIRALKSDIKWIQWILGFVAAGVGSLVLKTFF